jgi:trehalose/maltose hydrolase-like predicted phosphorylase
MVMEVQVLPDGNSTSHGVGVGAAAVAPFAMLRLVNSPGGASSDIAFAPVALPPDLPYSAVNGSTLVAETNSSGLQAVCVLTTDLPASGALAVSADEPFATAYFLTVVRTSIETPDPADLVSAAQADFAQASALAAQGTLRSSHIAEWAETVWPAGDETDRFDVARAVNSSLYAIVSSFRVDRPFGLAPGGLTNGYNGHSFWDVETWMWPGLNLLHPDMSESLLQYRVNRIAGAEEKAKSYAPPFAGSMFPWESALTGEEVCPTWAATGLREIHINGDIAFALWQFWRATQDDSEGWLEATAWPLLSGIAQFWMSKLAIDNAGAAPGSPLNLNNVIPPDEYADHANNSAYTNVGAILTLQYAAAVGALLGKPPADLAAWLDASARIVVPFNATGQYHPEYDAYALGQGIKQADVILLGL